MFVLVWGGKGQITTKRLHFNLQAACVNSKNEDRSRTYASLAQAYNLGIYAKQQAEYAETIRESETPKATLALEKITQTFDRRSMHMRELSHLAGVNAIADWMSELKPDCISFAHNDRFDGLNEMIAGIRVQTRSARATPIPRCQRPTATAPAHRYCSVNAGRCAAWAHDAFKHPPQKRNLSR